MTNKTKLVCLRCGHTWEQRADPLPQVRFKKLEQAAEETEGAIMKTTIQLNEITEIRITRSLTEARMFVVAMTKEFAPENGGGEQTFTELAGSIHHALDVARGMVTFSPAKRAKVAV